jgi:NTE family protein
VTGTAVVLAGGGERVLAWEVGVLAGLADRGFDVRDAKVVVGTSAGAVVAARCAASGPRSVADRIAARSLDAAVPPPSGAVELFAQLAAVWDGAGGGTAARRLVGGLAVERSPGGEAEFVARVGEGLPAEWPAGVRVVAVDVAAGEPVVLGAGSGVPLARAVAASRAIPVRCPPVLVGGRPHLDGALGSATNAGVVLGDVKDGEVDHVLVVTAAGFGTAAYPLWAEALAAEVEELTAAGAEVTVLEAGAGDRAAMGPDPMSAAGAVLAVTAGRDAGRRVAPQLRR